MKKLASCIPTYNRPDIIEEFLHSYMSVYQKLNIDVYIYDSSSDDDTKEVVAEYIPLYDNLNYVRMDSDIHSNMKVYDIYQHYQKEKTYEYLWVASDALRWTEDVMQEIMVQLQKSQYDILIINHHDVEHIGTREYTDKNELFLDVSWHMTLYGAAIVRMETLLKDVDWHYMIEKYCIPERINFSHVALYFEQILKLEKFRAFYYSFPEEKLITSKLKIKSGWQEETFKVWCGYWPDAINALPDFYSHKKEVIKKNGEYSGILTYQNIFSLRIQNIYSLKIFIRYFGRWHILVNVSLIQMFLLAVMPEEWLLGYRKNRAKWKSEQELKRSIRNFCKGYKCIYLYGCGIKADRYAGYLKKMRIKYKAYFVTERKDDKYMHEKHEVLVFDSSYLENPECGILMGLNEQNCSEVFTRFPELRDNKQVYCGR